MTEISASRSCSKSRPLLSLLASIGAAALLAVVLLAPSENFAQTPTAEQPRATGAARSIHQLYLDDQTETPAGKPGGVSPVTEKEFKEHGAARREQARVLLARREVKTAEDYHDASLLFQHGESADDFLLAHILAVEAVIRGDERSKWMAAATLDRYLQAMGKPQVFGTQYPMDPNVPIDPKADQHVAMYKGRTQNPFNNQLLPDSVRLDFCVPDLEHQKQNLATLNSGKYPDRGMVAPGCTR